MKVLVTGAMGQVGRCLVDILVMRKDLEVIALNRNTLDISKYQQVQSIVNSINPDVIINAAAYTAVDAAENDIEQCEKVNYIGPKNLAKAAEISKTLLIHISTDYVFDGMKLEPYNEEDETNPQGTYGKSKLNGELAIEEYCSRYAIIRTSWVFSEYGSNFLKTMLRLGAEKSELCVVGDQLGAPTYAGDLAEVLVAVMDKLAHGGEELSGVYHYSGFPYVTWYQFAHEIFSLDTQLVKKPKLVEIETRELSFSAPRPANSRLDCKKIRTYFGVTPSNWKLRVSKIVGCKI